MVSISIKDRRQMRKIRHRRIRKDIRGTARKPRLFVYKSNKHIYAQAINDMEGHTVTSASTLEPDLRDEIDSNNVQAAELVGAQIARRLLDKGIESVVFDRGGYPYHGKIRALAEKAREEGINF